MDYFLSKNLQKSKIHKSPDLEITFNLIQSSSNSLQIFKSSHDFLFKTNQLQISMALTKASSSYYYSFTPKHPTPFISLLLQGKVFLLIK